MTAMEMAEEIDAELYELQKMKTRLIGFIAGTEECGNHRMASGLRWVLTGDYDAWKSSDWTASGAEPLPAVHSPHD